MTSHRRQVTPGRIKLGTVATVVRGSDAGQTPNPKYPMKPWTRPPNYIGATWHGWIVFLSRNRDSSLLEKHNFETALATLKPLAIDVVEDGEQLSGVQAVSENHWAVGWIEWIAIHESNTAAIQAAELLEAKLENYPILSEMEYSRKEWEAYCEAWHSWGHREFIQELERSGLIEEGACDDCAPESTRGAFELLIPNGELYDSEGSPNVRYSIERAKREGLSNEVCQLLGLEIA